MIRLLKLTIGIPLILLGIMLALVAVTGFVTDSTASGRTVAVIMTACSILLLLLGRRLVRQPRHAENVTSLMYSDTANAIDAFQYLQISTGGKISVHADNAADAKAAIKELRVLKQSFSLQKRSVLDRQKAIRAQYTDQVRRRGSKFRGGGGFGRFVRDMQTVGSDSTRAQLARNLEPLESEKRRLEHAITQVDSLITQVQSHVLRMS